MWCAVAFKNQCCGCKLGCQALAKVLQLLNAQPNLRFPAWPSYIDNLAHRTYFIFFFDNNLYFFAPISLAISNVIKSLGGFLR